MLLVITLKKYRTSLELSSVEKKVIDKKEVKTAEKIREAKWQSGRGIEFSEFCDTMLM